MRERKDFEMKNNSKWVFGLVFVAGLTWSFAGGTKAKAENSGVTEKNAITIAEGENCVKATADCPKHADMDVEKKSGLENHDGKNSHQHSDVNCPKGADCPKDMHCAKPSMCHKNSATGTKTHSHEGAEATPTTKPVEETKVKVPEAH
jgi:anaerobic selenocysteine-containing dehydrogenase